MILKVIIRLDSSDFYIRGISLVIFIKNQCHNCVHNLKLKIAEKNQR